MLSRPERMLVARNLWPGNGGKFALLIALIGAAGVAIGVASLVLVISFMNGAEARLNAQIASADGSIMVNGRFARFRDASRLAVRLRWDPGIAAASASVEATGVVAVAGRTYAAQLQGVDRGDMQLAAPFNSRSARLVGKAPLQAGTVAMGGDMAARLGVRPGESIALITPRLVDGALTVDSYAARVAGIVTTGDDRFDSRRVVMPIGDFDHIVGAGRGTTRIGLTLADADKEEAVLVRLRKRLGYGFSLVTWRQLNPSLVAALAQERLGMIVAVSLVTLVALSNILSSMVMMVRQKHREIAILRTSGMSSAAMARVFLATGSAIGLVGMMVGLALGLTLAGAKDFLARELLGWLAQPSPELIVFASLPLTISGGEISWIVALVALGVVGSTVYPARRAASIDPAMVLRNG